MQITITNGTITKISETLSPNAGYTRPGEITVTPNTVTKQYNQSTGLVELTNLSTSDAMTITAAGVAVPDMTVDLLNIPGLTANTYKVKVRVSDGRSSRIYDPNESTISTWIKN